MEKAILSLLQVSTAVIAIEFVYQVDDKSIPKIIKITIKCTHIRLSVWFSFIYTAYADARSCSRTPIPLQTRHNLLLNHSYVHVYIRIYFFGDIVTVQGQGSSRERHCAGLLNGTFCFFFLLHPAMRALD